MEAVWIKRVTGVTKGMKILWRCYLRAAPPAAARMLGWARWQARFPLPVPWSPRSPPSPPRPGWSVQPGPGSGVCYTVHSWPQCPEGDIRPEAILSRAFGTSRTAIHRQVTLCKGPEWFHKPMYDFETPLRFCLGGHFLAVQIFLISCYLGGKISDGW